MLLILRSISRLLRPPQPSHARFLTTFPKPIPTYVAQWDPTRHAPQSVVPADSQQDAARRDARKRERAQLRQSQRFELLPRDTDCYAQEGHADVLKLNHLLRLADSKVARPGLHLMLRKVYHRLRERFSEVLYAMPDKAWDILWSTQERALSEGADAPHRKQLLKDMAECGKHEPVGRRIQYLYGVFSHGHEEQALREWEQDHAGANKLPRHDYKPEHLDVGARMFALHGCPDRAREIMEELFQLYPTWNSSIAKAVFRAHTKSASVGHHDLAEGIYKGHKQRSSKEMTLQDYDAYFVGFLEARHLPNAMAVFHDMVRQGRLATSLYPAEIEKVLARLHKLYRLGKDIVEINDIGLEAIELLPEAYHSHVYGHWMRAALGSSAPEASVEVLQFMVNRDFHPQTVHCNLFLKVLFRTKDTPHVLKAEDLGWRMIENARKAPIGKLPHAPASELISQWPKWIHERQMLMSNKEIAGKLPSANVTTFALMMRHHAAKLQWEHVDYLARQLKESGLHSNTEIMNILMDNKCRQGKFSEVWEIYRSLTDGPEGSPGVFPDGASIRCLWKTLRLALGDFATRDDPDLPRPRELLAETVQWWTRCRSRPDAERFRMGLAGPDHGALSSLMLHCFSYSKDLAGSLVSLHILRKHFLIFPSDTVAEVLQKHAAWVDLQRSTPQERSHFNRTGAHQQTLDKLGRIYYILEEQRKQRTGIAEEDYNRLSDEEIGDIGLNLLSEFVRVVMKRSYPPEEVEVMINQAKDEAGVPEMSTGDMDAFQVA